MYIEEFYIAFARNKGQNWFPVDSWQSQSVLRRIRLLLSSVKHSYVYFITFTQHTLRTFRIVTHRTVSRLKLYIKSNREIRGTISHFKFPHIAYSIPPTEWKVYCLFSFPLLFPLQTARTQNSHMNRINCKRNRDEN